MSSRQLKKLRAQEELAAQKRASGATSASGSDSDDEVDTRPRAKNAFAAFAALGDGGNNDDEDNEDEDEEEPQPQEEARPAQKTSKKKKKKKKKGKGEAEAAAEVATAATPTKPAKAAKAAQDTPPDDLDEIDRALQELNLQPGKTGTSASATAAPAKSIKVNFADLRVMNELREVFGREAMQVHAANEAQGGPARPRPAAGGNDGEGGAGMVQMDLETFLRAPPPPPRGMVYVNANGQRQAADGGMAAAVAKRNPFIQWKDTWPRGTSGGLSMKLVATDGVGGSGTEYTFVHSPAYVHLEDTFLTLVMMHNPQPLIQFLRQHPFHIASLIQVSRVAKLQDQNASLASDLCERALFSFGRSALSSFRQALAQGTARLSFYRPENRQFVLAAYHYIVALMGLGTYRTALAWTKLLLSVMPRDEYALLLFAQSLAVRAFEARWLVDYLGGEPAALTGSPMGAYVRQSLVPALVQAKDKDAARAALARGLQQLPWLYGALFQALGLDVPRAVWGITPRNDAETLYTQLYLHVSKELWDAQPVRALLQEVAASSPKADAASLPLPPPVSLSLVRFVYLDGTPALMGLVPQTQLHATPNYDFDPLPPPQASNIFSSMTQRRPWIMADSDAGHVPAARGLPGDFQLWEGVGEDSEDEVIVYEDGPEDEDEGEGEVYSDWEEQEVVDETRETQAEPRQGNGSNGNAGGGMPGAWFDEDD